MWPRATAPGNQWEPNSPLNRGVFCDLQKTPLESKENMGKTVAKLIADAPLSLEQKMSWHLRGNMEPPAPESMIPVAVQAVQFDAYGFDWDTTMLDLPTGSTYYGKNEASLRAIIEGHRLEFYLIKTDDNNQGANHA